MARSTDRFLTRPGAIVAVVVLLAAMSVAPSSARPTDDRAEVELALRATARTGRLPRTLTVAFSEAPVALDLWCCESFTLRENARLTR